MPGTVLMSLGERSLFAGQMVLIGMAAVFSVLIILWAALTIFRKGVAHFSGEGEAERKPQAPAPAQAPAPTPAPAPAAPASNDALIAAITAAVAAALAEENGGAVPAFRVVSFRRVSTVSKRK